MRTILQRLGKEQDLQQQVCPSTCHLHAGSRCLDRLPQQLVLPLQLCCLLIQLSLLRQHLRMRVVERAYKGRTSAPVLLQAEHLHTRQREVTW